MFTGGIGERLTRVVFVLVGVSFIVFSLLYLSPGDAATTLLGPQASENAKEQLRIELGLDRPLIVQFLEWGKNVLRGDFGMSIVSRNPVLSEVLPRYANSMLLAFVALWMAIVFGIVVGVVVAIAEGGIFDRTVMIFVQVFGVVPPFWLGYVLVYFFSLSINLFPTTGMKKPFGGGDIWDIATHLVLPAITAAGASSAVIVRLVRALMIECLNQDYIMVARARGVGPIRLLRRHVFPNCLPQILNIIGLQFGYLIGGVLFTEVVFAWPGIGNQLYQAILGRDVTVVQACVLLIALSFVFINLAVDLLTEQIYRRRNR